MAKEKTARHTIRPEFGKDYDLGWVGFVHGPSLLSTGIAYLTRRDKAGDVGVTHSFLVTGPDECVEANYPAGVVTSGLAESYFDQADGRVIFRKPKGLTKAATRRVVRRAKGEVGAKFDVAGMAAEGLGGTFLGHLVNSLFGDKPKDMVAGLLHQNGRYVCSDLVIYCFREEPKYRGKGAVARPVGTVSPQTLFEDEELFEPLPGLRAVPSLDRMPVVLLERQPFPTSRAW
jgi:hypothetical protein